MASCFRQYAAANESLAQASGILGAGALSNPLSKGIQTPQDCSDGRGVHLQ